MQGFDKYGIGAVSALPTLHLQRTLGLKSGVVTSGNSLDYTAEDMALMVQNEASIKVGGLSRARWSAWWARVKAGLEQRCTGSAGLVVLGSAGLLGY